VVPHLPPGRFPRCSQSLAGVGVSPRPADLGRSRAPHCRHRSSPQRAPGATPRPPYALRVLGRRVDAVDRVRLRRPGASREFHGDAVVEGWRPHPRGGRRPFTTASKPLHLRAIRSKSDRATVGSAAVASAPVALSGTAGPGSVRPGPPRVTACRYESGEVACASNGSPSVPSVSMT